MQRGTLRKGLVLVENTALVIISLATLVAIGQELSLMISNRSVHLSDLLLLFIYLEVIAMVGIYYDEHRLPVRYPLYIAMVALARFIILDSKELSWQGLMSVGATILLISLSILVHRYSKTKFPSGTRHGDFTHTSDPDK